MGQHQHLLSYPHGTSENQRTTQLTYGPSRESNRGHAHASHATYLLGLKALRAKAKSIVCVTGRNLM